MKDQDHSNHYFPYLNQIGNLSWNQTQNREKYQLQHMQNT